MIPEMRDPGYRAKGKGNVGGGGGGGARNCPKRSERTGRCDTKRLAKRLFIVDDAWWKAIPRRKEYDFVAHLTPHLYNTRDQKHKRDQRRPYRAVEQGP